MERYRFSDDGSVYYVAFSVVEWLPVFVTEETCRIVTESWNYCHRKRGLRVNAYVIMPTHLHAILFHESLNAGELEKVVTDFRKFTGRRLADTCCRVFPGCFGDVLREEAGADRERRFWQPSRHPVQILSESFWKTKIDYLHANPCRKGLVRRPGDWRFSSASYWMTDRAVENDVVLSPIPG